MKVLPPIIIVGFPPIKPLPSIKDCFNNNKKHTIMEKEKKIEAPEGCEIGKVELVDGVAVVTFREKERKLPKSWEEFCDMFPVKKEELYISDFSNILNRTDVGDDRHIEEDKNVLPDSATAEAVLALCQLIQLRNAYNEGWVPDWEDENRKYTIDFYEDEIFSGEVSSTPSILTFKSRELRDEFLRNFRPLIEKLKTLYGIKEGCEQ